MLMLVLMPMLMLMPMPMPMLIMQHSSASTKKQIRNGHEHGAVTGAHA
jgi:hypothetical protein